MRVLIVTWGMTALLSAQTAFSWLSDPVHPRGIALANASVAGPGMTEALDLNPAGLRWGGRERSSTRSFLVGLSHYAAGLNQQLTQLVLPVARQVVALELRRFDYGTFAGYDENAEQLGDYTAADLLIRGGLARPFGRYLSLGMSVGALSSRLEEVTAKALLWSLGAQLDVVPLRACLGVAVLNQGRFISSFGEDMDDGLPAAWLVGLEKSLAYLPLTIHLSTGRTRGTDQLVWRMGGEFQLPRGLKLRFGVDQGKMYYIRGNTYADLLSGFSLGLGIETGGLGDAGTTDRPVSHLFLDGAVKYQGPLGVSSALALGLKF
ncbi:MAG: hypothetical protein JSU61_06805 [Fidelibacterota bacterium]|nr:MAG: hypothetical protein JSU61_06805 [Candidatus Neomarinimicrobiota bacterium]